MTAERPPNTSRRKTGKESAAEHAFEDQSAPECPKRHHERQQMSEDPPAAPIYPLGDESVPLEVSQTLSCVVCRALLYESSRCIPCQHVFCRSCISRFQDCVTCGAVIERVDSDLQLQGRVDRFIDGHSRIRRPPVRRIVESFPEKECPPSNGVSYEDVALARGSFLIEHAMRAFQAQNFDSAKWRLQLCAHETRQELSKSDTAAGTCSQLGAVLEMLGDCCRSMGDAQGSMMHYQESVELLLDLPNKNVEVAHVLCAALSKLGDLKYGSEKLTEALEFYTRALVLRQHAKCDFTKLSTQVLDAAALLAKVADVNRALGNKGPAKEGFQGTMKTLECLSSLNASDNSLTEPRQVREEGSSGPLNGTRTDLEVIRNVSGSDSASEQQKGRCRNDAYATLSVNSILVDDQPSTDLGTAYDDDDGEISDGHGSDESSEVDQRVHGGDSAGLAYYNRTVPREEIKKVSTDGTCTVSQQEGSRSDEYATLPVSLILVDGQYKTDLGTPYDDDVETKSSEVDGLYQSSEGEQRVHNESTQMVNEKPTDPEMIQNCLINNLKSEEVQSDDSEYDSGSDTEDKDHGKWVYPEFKLSEEDRNYGVDERDMGTADSWVKRHPELIRLTGRHPFNCEAPLPKLMAQGFLTPTNLHYVRNHGYVPQGVWEEWRIEICGRVRRPCKLSMNDLVTKFRKREVPVTLVCAGNRRMEQNMTSKTIGFNWGAAGLSTSTWKGVRLRDVLLHCGVISKKKGAAFVCFEGAETLPAGGGTRYGTSITIDTALDEGRDVLIAFHQNGKVLDPDHGYPVRMILPGHIGGRMVKWLTKIEVTPKESFNYYHFNDNRVLPSHVDAEMAKAEGWWYKPDYLINELNINSAISTPAHDEVLPFEATHKPYTVKGYAYTGGGRKVIRVELSMDAGVSWRLCDVKYNEKPTEYGKYWCWVLWQLDVEVTDFLHSKELVVRAWDASMNTQPERLTWNVMGMMNNCWFRVKVEACKTNIGGIGLNFQHPTLPGKQPGGWMYAENVANAPPVGSTTQTMQKSVSLASQSESQIPMSEVRRHTDSESAWIVVHDVVYDCTPFLKDHPGGADSILLTAGTDATEEFDGIHSEKAKVMLEKYKVGVLAAETEPADNSAFSTPDSSLRGGSNFPHLAAIPEASPVLSNGCSSARPVALNPRERINLKLIEKEILSADIRKFRFALQSKDHILGLPVGKHVLIAAKIRERLVMRAYTPTSCDKDVGYFDLLVKVYVKSDNFPMGGLMSQHLDSLNLGDTIGVKGPLGHIHYQGRGKFTVHGAAKFVKKFALIAGGTGITPMYQIIRAVLEDPEDTTEISLIYSNRTEDDIMAREQLDQWQEKHSNFKIWYTLSGKPRDGWPYGHGRINEQMMRDGLPAGGSANTFACLCGPTNLESMCLDTLHKMGYDKENCFSF